MAAMMMTAEDVMTVVIEMDDETIDPATTETDETETTTAGTEGTTAETTVGTETTETTAEAATDEEEEEETGTETLMTAAEAQIKVLKSSAQAMRTDHLLQKEPFQFRRGSVFAQVGTSRLPALRTLQLLRLR